MCSKNDNDKTFQTETKVQTCKTKVRPSASCFELRLRSRQLMPVAMPSPRCFSQWLKVAG